MNEQLGDVLTIEGLSAYLKIPKLTSISSFGKAKSRARRLAATGASERKPSTAGWKRRTAIRKMEDAMVDCEKLPETGGKYHE